MRRMRIIVLLAVAVLASGCSDFKFPSSSDEADPEVELSRLRGQIRELEAKVAQLRDTNSILRTRILECNTREKQLSVAMNRLKLLNEGLEGQIEALKDAPGERDAYKARVDKLTEAVERLKALSDRLMAEIEKRDETIMKLRSEITKPPAN